MQPNQRTAPIVVQDVPPATAILIVNTFSRRGEKFFFKALDALENKGIEVIASYPVRRPEMLEQIILEALALKSDVVVVGGGDGTISTVVDYFVGKDAVLGLLPLGTGNSFIRTLGIPLDLYGAVDVIKNGKIVQTDLGVVNGDYFANVVSIGFAADVAKDTPRKLKRLLGPLAYGLVGLRRFFTTSKFKAVIDVDGVRHTVHTHNIIVANGSVYGIMPLQREADVDNGQLLVLTMDMLNRWQHLLFWLRFFVGSHRDMKGAKYLLGSSIQVTTTPVRTIDIDGDNLARTPADFQVAPGALRVKVPMRFHEH